MMMVITYWGIAAIGSAVLASLLAAAKRLDVNTWAGVCFLVPAALLVLVLWPASSAKDAHDRRVREALRGMAPD